MSVSHLITVLAYDQDLVIGESMHTNRFLGCDPMQHKSFLLLIVNLISCPVGIWHVCYIYHICIRETLLNTFLFPDNNTFFNMFTNYISLEVCWVIKLQEGCV